MAKILLTSSSVLDEGMVCLATSLGGVLTSRTNRICPGRHFAESSLFLICASLLWAFDIGPSVNEHGVPVPVERKVSTNVVIA